MKQNKNENTETSASVALANLTNIFLLLFMLFFVLYIGASLIIPFIIALLLTFAIIALYNFFKKLRFPPFLAIILSILTYLIVFWLIGVLIQSNVNELIGLIPTYQKRVSELFVSISSTLNLPSFMSISTLLNGFDLQGLASSIVSSVTSVLSSAGLILLYIAFLLFEYRFFREKINLILSSSKNKGTIITMFEKIKGDVKTYFVVKVWISFISAFISYLIMFFFNLDFAAFWAVLLFILNFIPNIGSIIAIAMPSILSFVQPEFAIMNSIIMIILLVGLDQLIGNIVEPKFMGDKLNLSPVVIILALAFWGMVWGIVGMFLSAPIMVIVNIILSRIPATRPIAILLSEKGKLPVVISR